MFEGSARPSPHSFPGVRVEKYVYLFSELDRAEAAAGRDWEAVKGLQIGRAHV